MINKPDRSFFDAPTLQVARSLLGMKLCRRTSEGLTAGYIIETEGYLGEDDKACHSYKRRSPDGRTNIMYGESGYAYVYLVYGMYYCFNVVTRPSGIPEAVLVRALFPSDGIKLMEMRRNTGKQKALCSGPGKLCKALSIDKSCYGLDLLDSELYIEYGIAIPDIAVDITPRINIAYAGEDADKPYRFVIKDTGIFL
ncbi:MAG: DNA-3-methyladenine glycosylase [Eubacteriales bacterium]